VFLNYKNFQLHHSKLFSKLLLSFQQANVPAPFQKARRTEAAAFWRVRAMMMRVTESMARALSLFSAGRVSLPARLSLE
jgi:hypothetical protein